MSQHDDVQQQVTQLAREVQELRREREVGARQRRWVFRSAAALAAVAVLVGGVQTALAAGSCPQTLPAPLSTFCADEPARASELNADLLQLVTWLEQKAGTVGSPNVTITGTQTVGSGLTVNGGLVSGSSVPLCIQTWDCAEVTDTCASAFCPAGKVAAGAVMPTSCGGSTNHKVNCCRLRLVAPTSGGVCP